MDGRKLDHLRPVGNGLGVVVVPRALTDGVIIRMPLERAEDGGLLEPLPCYRHVQLKLGSRLRPTAH